MIAWVRFISLVVVAACTLPLAVFAEVVEYQFDIDYQMVNFTGEPVRAMSVGGSIPAPTIEATVGDTLRVTFTNKMQVPSSIHWHGVLLPQDQDGVPFLTMPPIQPGSSFTYEYPVVHHGTYWHHSHTGLQEQRGVYGAIVFHPQGGEVVQADHDVVVVLSDWTDENPNRVMHNLKKSDDYYALKKDSVQSWDKVIQHGSQAIRSRIDGAWMRMGPMDISDVGYDTFLVNGNSEQQLPFINAGETVRLRVINAAASSYFNVEFAGGAMTLVASDGVDIEPVVVNRQRIAIAETFDAVVTIGDGLAHEFRATSEDGTGYSSLLLGRGERLNAPARPRPNPFGGSHAEMNHKGMNHKGMNHKGMNHKGMNHKGMNHSDMGDVPTSRGEYGDVLASQPVSEYAQLRATQSTRFAERPTREVLLKLTGDMQRYAWSFNNKVLSEESTILIRKGETVRFILDNTTMMHHPIHLHGHFFRVLNGQGDYAPLKHTVNVPALQRVTIEFLADEEKDWLFHCHNLYHMKSGMTRVVSYAETTAATKKSLTPMFSDRHWYYFFDVAAQNNVARGDFRAENTRNAVNVEVEWDYDDDYELEFVYARYLNRFLAVYAGAEIEQETEKHVREKEELGVIGAYYTLPLLIMADVRLDSDGDARLALSSELQLTKRLAFDWDVNTDDEYHLQLAYELSKQAAITGGVDDQFDWGIGLEFRY